MNAGSSECKMMFKVIYNAKVCEFIEADSKEKLRESVNIDEITIWRKEKRMLIENINSIDTINKVYPCSKSDCVYYGSSCADVNKYAETCQFYRKEHFNEYG